MSPCERPQMLYVAPMAFDFSPDANALQQPCQLGRRFPTALLVPPGVVVPDAIREACIVVRCGTVAFGKPRWLRSFLDEAPGAAGQFRSSGCTVVVGVSGQPGAEAAGRAAQACSMPWIWSCWDHPFGTRYRQPGPVRAIERQFRTVLLRRRLLGAAAVALSYGRGGLDFLSLPGGLVVEVGNGVLAERLEVIRGAVEEREGLVVSIGAMSWDKGGDLILDAFAGVAAQRPDARLRLLGPIAPDFRATYEERVRSPLLVDRVEGCGDLPWERAMELAAEGEVGLCAYRPLEWLRHNQVLKIGEYQALGLAVVAHDLPGTRELVTDRVDGRLVPCEAPEAMARTIIELLGDATQRESLVAAGRNRAAARDWSVVGDRFAELVLRIAGRTGTVA